jgi:hypothetical protein
MQSIKLLSLAVGTAILAACSSSSNSPTVNTAAPTNTGGGTITGVQTAQFDTVKGFLPFPNNLLLNGSTDLTLNPPVANPLNTGDPAVALSALDGFGTNAPWSTTFSVPINPATVIAGNTVRMYEVTRQAAGIGITGFVRELAANTDFVAVVSPSTEVASGAGIENNGKAGIRLAVLPTRALEAGKTYLVVVTKAHDSTVGGHRRHLRQSRPADSDRQRMCA